MKTNGLMEFAGVCVVAGMAWAGTDGTWSSTTTGGDWNTAANWVDGVMPENGVATFDFTGQTGRIDIQGAGRIPLTELRYSGALRWNRNVESVFSGMLFDMTGPAKITVMNSSIDFSANMLTNETTLTFAGTGRSIVYGPQQLKGKVLLTDGGWVRVVSDSALGPKTASLVPDAITLDGGILQNGGNTTVSATRGITVTEKGGAFTAGYNAPANLTLLPPVTGPGGIDIAYENSPVVLSNPANDWRGDTRVGTLQCDGTLWGANFALTLGADEVIPHGEGRGRLILGPYASCTNAFNVAPIDLNGHVETVNSVEASYRGAVNSSTPGGILKTCDDSDMDFRGSIGVGATLEKHGTGMLTFASGTGVVNGELALHEGALELAASCVGQNGRISLYGGSATIVPLRGLFCWRASTLDGAFAYNGRHIYPYYGFSNARFDAVGNKALYRARWHLDTAGTYSFAKSYRGLAALWIDGSQIISNNEADATIVVRDVSLTAGWHDVELLFARSTSASVGTGAFANSGIVYDAQNGAFKSNEEIDRACIFTDDAGPNLLASGYPSLFGGILDLKSDATLSVAADAEPFVFAGRLVTDPENPHTLTVTTSSGAPLAVGGSSASAAAILEAPLLCASGLVMTNHVWVKAPLPENTVMAPNATITYDYPDALAEGRTLTDYDLRVTSQGLGDGTLVVPTGRRVIFSTQSVTDGVLIDEATGTRTYANNVVLQGGVLEFDGAGTTSFNGTVSGFGKILRSGTGAVVFRNGAALTDGCEIEITGGVFRLAAGGALGAATIHLHNGRFGNVEGESFAIDNPFLANGGGVEVLGPDAVMTLNGRIQHRANISLWGDGTLRLAGNEANGAIFHVRGGTLALAKPSAAQNVIGCESCCTLRLESSRALPTAASINLDGGTLDMGGNDLAIQTVNCRNPASRITNNGSADTTLTILGGTDTAFSGTLADGTGRLFLEIQSNTVWNFFGADLANSGMNVVTGAVAFAGPETLAGSLFRFTATKARPAPSGNPNWGGSGIQFSELRLLCDGQPVTWPAGTMVSASKPVSGSEMASNIVDGQTATKWYASGGYGLPATITCPSSVTFDAYQIATANDAPGRDPVSWTFEIGSVTGSTTNWMTLDTKVDVSNDVPTARLAYMPAISLRKTHRFAVLPPDYRLNVAATGTATFDWCEETLNALSGNGLVLATNGASLTIGGDSTFCGTVASAEPVRLDFDTATLPAISATEGTVLLNDGVTGALTFADAGMRMTAGALKDGTAPLGLAVTGDSTLVLSGGGSTHTGPTTVGTGAVVKTLTSRMAKYFRFTPVKSTANVVKRNMQLSEVQLLCDGVYMPWPKGTKATSHGDNSVKNEGAAQLIDGSVETKCYWNSATDAVLITAPDLIYFEGYQWYTANDSMTARNPVSWTFEYSNDGVNWILFDEQADRATVDTIKTLAYVYQVSSDEIAVADALSDASPLALAAAATCSVTHVEETVGALSGAGVLQVEKDAVVRLNTAEDAVFAGEIVGRGVLAKAGTATQTLGGVVSMSGTLVVEAGTLKLEDASLLGITNIVLRGGVLAGTATVGGDLTVRSEGGVYAASLAVAGKLTLVGQPTLETGFAGAVVRGTAFTCGSSEAASQALFASALCAETIQNGWKFNCQASPTKFAWSVVPGGTIFYFR